MQSKTSFFNKTVFRKNLTRFAPVWGLYTVGMVLCLVLSALNRSGSDGNFFTVQAIAELANVMAIVNCGYALVVSQALFGDLFNSRSCYALHAMPVRRETWYCTNIISGILFSLAPTLVAALCAIPMVAGSCVVNAWAIPLLTFAAANLQYICFFGIAVACIFCAGNRLGMLMLYGMVNCAAAVLGMLIEALYLDFLFGVRIASNRYLRFSPIVGMTDKPLFWFDDFWDLRRAWELDGKTYELTVPFTLDPQAWGYLAICAAVGAVLLVAGLFLYKRRKLECAGDFLAFKKLGTAFQAVFAFGVGALFQLAYTGYSSQVGNGFCIFMGIGITLGWFGGRMLLDRTTRVFRKKSLVGLAAVMAAVALSVGLTALDPMGFEAWVPQADEVEKVYFSGWTFGTMELTSPEDIEKMLYLHQAALEERLEGDGVGRVPKAEAADKAEADLTEGDYSYLCTIDLSYLMKDGSTPIRHYTVWVDSELGQLVKDYASSPEAVLGRYQDRFDIKTANLIRVNNLPLKNNSTPEEIQSLYAALMADCEEGNMASGTIFHKGYFDFGESQDDFDEFYGRYGTASCMDIQIETEGVGLYVSVWADSAHTIKWLEDRGVLTELHATVVPNAYPPNVG